ncbi:hypothetical protein P3X46_004837 [Hevea brasiliensis]|uniref:Uncharacterized protein n=1 Tax=Hevea brasiliensis TaxID=3981 RepID=A0ABQ9MY05_HEVBR|nr:uncharacterized protein LOC110652154 [Hevea brasiliensis]KAJ9185177.1 hypothetical protein P3X46_004837 [Hevea brasiliensis]
MSWLRSAVYRAVEAGGNTNLTRTVRSYADTVVLQAGNAVAEGAKIIQHRIGSGNSKSFKITVKRLEEVSVSCRGMERVQLLRRWLVALKEAERLFAAYSENNDKHPDERIISDEFKDSPKKPTVDCYVDPDLGTMNFRDAFLYSQALEGMTLSMILEAPNEEEVSLLLEIFGLCLAGGKEVHKAVMSSIQDLALAFSSYQDEVLVKREELLQYAQCAISGLKIDAHIARIDAEACSLIEKLDKMKKYHQSPYEPKEQSSEETTIATVKALEETLGQIEVCSMLEELLLKKKSLNNGDSPGLHAGKVDKLKVLLESLLNSTSKAERRILDNRSQKEEALNFRVAKAGEVSQLEKELANEIGELERHKDELEAELKKVNSSLTAARARLHNAREEREQFDEASNQIIIHLKAREDELSRSISSCRVEADVVNTWIHFLEDTWSLHTTYIEQKQKQVNAELERYGDYFVNLVVHLLTSYKEQLGSSIIHVRGLVGDLHSCQRPEITPSVKDDDSIVNQRKILEKEYLDLEGKFLTTLSTVYGVKKQYYSGNEGIYRKDDERIKELFNALEKLKEEFESIKRPVLEVEKIQRSQSPSSPHVCLSPSSKQAFETAQNKHHKKGKLSLLNGRKSPALVELEQLESELGKDDTDYLTDEIGEWEFDALEKELNATSLKRN